MIRKILLSALPHVAAIGLFALLSCTFLSPVFDGFMLNQGDARTFAGMSREIKEYRKLTGEDPLWTDAMFSGMPAYQIAAEHPGNLIKPLDKLVKMGLPLQVDLLFLAMLGFYILLLCLRVNPWVSIPFAAAYGLGSIFILYMAAGHTSKMYALAYMAPTLGGVLMAFRGKIWQGAAVAGLFGALHLSANHLQMTYYFILLASAVVLAEIVRLLAEKNFGHLLRSTGTLAIAALAALMANMGNIMTTHEYSDYSTRGKTELNLPKPGNEADALSAEEGLEQSYMLEYSMSRGEFWSFMIPDVKGGKSGYLGADRALLENVDRELKEAMSQQMRYWGDQAATGGAFYIGAALCCLFLLWFFAGGDKGLKIAMGLLLIVSVMLSWKNVNGLGQWFIDSFPYYNKFRDTKMILVLVMLILPLGAALFVDRLVRGLIILRAEKRNIIIGSGLVLLIPLVFLLKPDAFFSFSNAQEQGIFDMYLEQSADNEAQADFIYALTDELPLVRQKLFKSDVQRSLLLVVLALGGVAALLFTRAKAYLVVPAFSVVLIADVWNVDRRYLSTENPRRNNAWIIAEKHLYPFEPTQADLAILQAEIDQHPEWASDVEALNKQIDKDKKSELQKSLSAFAVARGHSNYRVLSFSGPFSDASVAYFHKSIGGYHGAKLKRMQELIDHRLTPEMLQLSEDAKVMGIDSAMLKAKCLNMLNMKYLIASPTNPPVTNRHAMGDAWFVKEVIWAEDANDEMQTLADADLRTQAVIDQRFAELLVEPATTDSLASITLTSTKPNQKSYSTESTVPGLVVFSEVHYPAGWNCYVDGNPVQYGRANYLLRALALPAGKHEVVFRFEPESHRIGNRVALAGSGVILILLLIGAVFQWKNKSTYSTSIKA